jgi:hypothetical protein
MPAKFNKSKKEEIARYNLVEETEKRISNRLFAIFKEINDLYTSWYGKSAKLVEEAYRIATEEENYSPQEAAKLIYDNIKGVSDRTIRKHLPQEAKDISKRRLKSQSNVAEHVPQTKKFPELDKIIKSQVVPAISEMQADTDKLFIIGRKLGFTEEELTKQLMARLKIDRYTPIEARDILQDIIDGVIERAKAGSKG